MALIEVPAVIQPAFNELHFIDNANTSIDVSGVAPSPAKTITLRRVLTRENGVGVPVARFDARPLVSRLFVDKRIVVVPSVRAGLPEWCFEDLNLKVNYSVQGTRFVAVNAVKQIGESLDLVATERSPIMSLAEKIGSRYTIPVYEGFPIGVTIMYTKEYDEIPRVPTIVGQIVAGKNMTIGTHFKI